MCWQGRGRKGTEKGTHSGWGLAVEHSETEVLIWGVGVVPGFSEAVRERVGLTSAVVQCPLRHPALALRQERGRSGGLGGQY